MHHPGDLVCAMHCLLDEAVAAEPYEVVPVSDLPFGVAHAGRALARRRHRLDGICVIGGVVGDYPADGASCTCFTVASIKSL